MREIAETARKTGTLFMEAMKSRFVPIFPEIIKVVKSGEIGESVQVETSFCTLAVFDSTHSAYHTQSEQGGALLDVGTYCASWIQEFFGCPERVKKVTANVRGNVDYSIDAELEFNDKKSARLECAFDRRKEINDKE